MPYPNSVLPAEVLANIKAIARQTHLADALGVAEIEMRHDELRVRRILHVKSEWLTPAEYMVVELEDLEGHPIANVALTKAGDMMGAEDLRKATIRRPLEIGDAVSRVRARLARLGSAGEVGTAQYVFFPNLAEPGSSVFRPLAAVTTASGTVYLNSAGDAFAEDESAVVAELGREVKGHAIIRAARGHRLRALGRW